MKIDNTKIEINKNPNHNEVCIKFKKSTDQSIVIMSVEQIQEFIKELQEAIK